MNDLVELNLAEASHEQKVAYDRHSFWPDVLTPELLKTLPAIPYPFSSTLGGFLFFVDPVLIVLGLVARSSTNLCHFKKSTPSFVTRQHPDIHKTPCTPLDGGGL